MDHSETRITVLRQYIALLRHEVHRLNLERFSPTANHFDASTCEIDLRRAAQKIVSAEKELKQLEGR